MSIAKTFRKFAENNNLILEVGDGRAAGGGLWDQMFLHADKYWLLTELSLCNLVNWLERKKVHYQYHLGDQWGGAAEVWHRLSCCSGHLVSWHLFHLFFHILTPFPFIFPYLDTISISFYISWHNFLFSFPFGDLVSFPLFFPHCLFPPIL